MTYEEEIDLVLELMAELATELLIYSGRSHDLVKKIKGLQATIRRKNQAAAVEATR